MLVPYAASRATLSSPLPRVVKRHPRPQYESQQEQATQQREVDVESVEQPGGELKNPVLAAGSECGVGARLPLRKNGTGHNWSAPGGHSRIATSAPISPTPLTKSDEAQSLVHVLPLLFHLQNFQCGARNGGD